MLISMKVSQRLTLKLITFEYGARIALEEIDGAPIAPATVALHQTVRHLIVRRRDQRLNAVFRHLVE